MPGPCSACCLICFSETTPRGCAGRVKRLSLSASSEAGWYSMPKSCSTQREEFCLREAWQMMQGTAYSAPPERLAGNMPMAYAGPTLSREGGRFLPRPLQRGTGAGHAACPPSLRARPPPCAPLCDASHTRFRVLLLARTVCGRGGRRRGGLFLQRRNGLQNGLRHGVHLGLLRFALCAVHCVHRRRHG